MRRRARISRLCCWTLGALALSALWGCGRQGASVSGTVTLNGTPLQGGTVSFIPVGGGTAATGSVRADGTYTIATGAQQGLPPGEYVVTVFANEPPPLDTSAETVPKVLTPSIYGDRSTTPLKFTVSGGTNKIDLLLTGEPPK